MTTPSDPQEELDCADLHPRKVFDELSFCINHNATFLNYPPSYWLDHIAEEAQRLADEMDPDEYEWLGIERLEKP